MFHVSPSRLTCRLLYILGEFSENKFTFACPHAGANRPDALGELVSDAAVDERALFFHFTAIDAVFLFLKTIYETYRCRAFVPANGFDRGNAPGRCSGEGDSVSWVQLPLSSRSFPREAVRCVLSPQTSPQGVHLVDRLRQKPPWEA